MCEREIEREREHCEAGHLFFLLAHEGGHLKARSKVQIQEHKERQNLGHGTYTTRNKQESSMIERQKET